MVYYLLCFLKVSEPSQKFVDLEVSIVSLEAFGEFLELGYFSEKVVDISVQLLDHIAHGLLEFCALFLDSLLLDAYFCLQGIQQLGGFVESLVVLLSEGVVNGVEELKPRFN